LLIEVLFKFFFFLIQLFDSNKVLQDNKIQDCNKQ